MSEKILSMNEKEATELIQEVQKRSEARMTAQMDEKIFELTDAVEKQGTALRGMMQFGGADFGSPMSKIISDNKKSFESLANGESKGLKFNVPRATVNKALVARANVVDSTLALRLPDVGQIAHALPVMRSLFRSAQVGPNSGGVVRYFEQNEITRGATTVDEGGEKPESSFEWKERSMQIQKIADSSIVTMEALKDFDFMASEIERLLTVNVALKEDAQLYSGDGNAPNLKGVHTTAAAFDHGSYSGPKIDNANLFDLIILLRAQIISGKQSKFMPNVVLVNPNDFVAYRNAKASDGHYVLPGFLSADGGSVAGMRIIESNQVTANTLLVGDFRFGTLYDLEGINISVGHVDDQFIKNQATILAEMRTGLLIRNQDVDAFLKVTAIDDAIAAIETP